ncbi:hypothetical protein [Leifsonia poae]|uniref:hypothetical protein n=1 Tax=Leifsonia poae TaxID=110933 RepID=UPI001CBE3469|nr:hypothetical protein [Leifsonia poae]
MGTEIELISDGDGVAIFGDPTAVERFLSSAGLPSKEIALRPSLGSALSAGSGVAQAGARVAENSGRWVKLTEESAKALKLGKAMKGSSDGVSRAIATTSKGKVTKILEFVKPGSVGSMLTNPAMLAGAAGIMAQLAMQQTMEEITQYLAVIDEKVDDVLRAQKDAAIAEMIGVGIVIDDAMIKREHVGRVSEVTWSNLHGAAQSIATTQSYALRQLDALAEKLEKKRKVGELMKASQEAEKSVEEWLAVLARCFQLQDGLAILELDRVLDSAPDDLDRHREAIQAGRRKRRDLIASTTQGLLKRMDAAAGLANTKVLLHPIKAGAVVRSGNEVGIDVADFNSRLGIQEGRDALEAKRWGEAVGDARDAVAHTASTSAAATARFSAEAFANAKSVASGVSANIAEHLPGKPDEDSDDAERD